MGNCAGYCNGQGENVEGQISGFNKTDINNFSNNNLFEDKYGRRDIDYDRDGSPAGGATEHPDK